MSAAGQVLPFVTLNAAGQQYAVLAASVTEIVGLQQLTKVPKMPTCVRGLMNLRGTVVPVVDLAEKLGFARTAITPQTCVVIVSTAIDSVATTIGIIVDEVVDVISLPAADISSPPAFGSSVDPAYLTGITRLSDRYVLVLDLTRVLAPEELLSVTRQRGKMSAAGVWNGEKGADAPA